MKTWKYALILLGLSAAIVAGFVGGTVLSRASGIQPTSWPPNMNVDEWKTYTNTNFYFSFKYPADWYIEELLSSDVNKAEWVQISNYPLDRVGNKPKLDNYFKMVFLVRANEPLKEGQSLDDWLQFQWFYESPQVKQKRSLTIDNHDAREYAIEYFPGMIASTINLVIEDTIYGNLILEIGASPFDQPEMEDVFRLIAATVHFEK